MIVEIRGSDLPGLRCGPAPDGNFDENIHVGLHADPRPSSSSVGTRRPPGGSSRSPFATSRTGSTSEDRRPREARGGPPRAPLGTLDDGGSFTVFRAAKLRFSDVDPSALRHAVKSGGRLIGSIGLTDDRGWPRCASVRPPDVTWSAVET
jgi:hypothetical protein